MSFGLSDKLYEWLRKNQLAAAKEAARALGAERTAVNSILYSAPLRFQKSDGQPPRWEVVDGDDSASTIGTSQSKKPLIAASTIGMIGEEERLAEQRLGPTLPVIEPTQSLKERKRHLTAWLFPKWKGFRRSKNGGIKAVTEDWLEIQSGGKCLTCFAKIAANAMACPECESPERVDLDQWKNPEFMVSEDKNEKPLNSEEHFISEIDEVDFDEDIDDDFTH